MPVSFSFLTEASQVPEHVVCGAQSAAAPVSPGAGAGAGAGCVCLHANPGFQLGRLCFLSCSPRGALGLALLEQFENLVSYWDSFHLSVQ